MLFPPFFFFFPFLQSLCPDWPNTVNIESNPCQFLLCGNEDIATFSALSEDEICPSVPVNLLAASENNSRLFIVRLS